MVGVGVMTAPTGPEQRLIADDVRLLKASVELCKHIGTGLEPAGQSMDITMAQYAVREFRKAVQAAQRAKLDSQYERIVVAHQEAGSYSNPDRCSCGHLNASCDLPALNDGLDDAGKLGS